VRPLQSDWWHIPEQLRSEITTVTATNQSNINQHKTNGGTKKFFLPGHN